MSIHLKVKYTSSVWIEIGYITRHKFRIQIGVSEVIAYSTCLIMTGFKNNDGNNVSSVL